MLPSICVQLSHTKEARVHHKRGRENGGKSLLFPIVVAATLAHTIIHSCGRARRDENSCAIKSW